MRMIENVHRDTYTHRWSTCQRPVGGTRAPAQTPRPPRCLPRHPPPVSSPWPSERRCGTCTSASRSWRTFSGAISASSLDTASTRHRHSFARNNTRRGIETCGILAGTLSANDSIFTISTLIIPKQEGTTDTVQALGEEEIFDVQDSRGLYPLGWIHTHPTQSCFLSSIDVHTHCGYQVWLWCRVVNMHALV